MIDATNMRLVANLLGTQARPPRSTLPVGRSRQDPLAAVRASRRAGTEGGAGGEEQWATSRVANPQADVVVHLSPEAVRAAREAASVRERSHADAAGTPGARGAGDRAAETAAPARVPAGKRTEQDQEETRELERRDREVRQHEATHKAALGRFANGAPRLTFTTGPDGQRYAVGGEVSVDVSPVPGDPQATIQKMTTIRRAALAPQHPSAADQAIAAEATRKMRAAQQELRAEQLEEQKRGDPTSAPVGDASAVGGTAHGAAGLGQHPFRVHQQFFGAPADQRGHMLDIRA